MEYKFFYKKKFFWKVITAIGHNYSSDQDRMDVYLPGGGIISIAKWSFYDLKLGGDWYLAVTKKMQQESSQPIKTL